MRKDRFFKWLLCCIAVCMMVLPGIRINAAESDHQANRFNVVFVMDSSKSMEWNDASDWRFDAVDLFLGLSADTGNYMGAVIFNDTIIDGVDLEELNGRQSKVDFSEKLRQTKKAGQTNVGMALLEAVKMLDEYANRDLPSVIILLTDGVTELPADEMDEADEAKKNAIDYAKKNHYPVYSVCLNQDSKAAVDELKDISRKTEGKYLEMAEEQNIKDVFLTFYEMIYDTETMVIMDEVIPESGILEDSFSIPEFGVEEANIIISTLNKNASYEIFRPDGNPLTKEELKDMTISAGTFSVIKVIDPDPGEWNVTVTGTAGDQIVVRMVFNADYEMYLENQEKELDYDLGESLSLSAYLITESKRLENAQIYLNHKKDVILEIEHNGECVKTHMTAQKDGYTSEYKFDDYGIYIFRVNMIINGAYENSGELTVWVNNHDPQTTQEHQKWNISEWLFGRRTYTLDVTSMAVDQEDSELGYEIVNCDEAVIQKAEISSDGLLSIQSELEPDAIWKGKLRREGSVTVRAVDSQGAACEFEVEISLFAVNVLLCRIFMGVVVALVLAVIVHAFLSRNKKFNGDITVVSFDIAKGKFGRSVTIESDRGVVKLGDYIQEGYGIDLRKTRLWATGKDYIFFKASKGYYSSGADRKTKKIRVDTGDEVTISNEQDQDSGIKITYHYNGSEYI